MLIVYEFWFYSSKKISFGSYISLRLSTTIMLNKKQNILTPFFTLHFHTESNVPITLNINSFCFIAFICTQQDLTQLDVKYAKIYTEGHVVPSKKVRSK